ncbi:MAG: GNAT family N-acetyltransferase, partial [Vicinamibacterales bacterium]
MSPVGAIDVVVKDGSTVCLRLAVSSDVGAIVTFLQALSPASRYFRFLGFPSLTPARIQPLIESSDGAASALIAEAGGRVVAFAGFHRDAATPARAEVAFAVADAAQGHGIGTRLLEQLARLARERRITHFDAYVMAENRRMLDLFRDSGFTVTTALEDQL